MESPDRGGEQNKPRTNQNFICMNETTSLPLNGSNDEAKIKVNNLKNSMKCYCYGINQLE